ncbi:SPOR domain-containing protein [Albidovulum sp.]
MANYRTGLIGVGLVTMLALTGCEDGRFAAGGAAQKDAAPPVAGKAAAGATVEQDVEAPEAFSMTGPALWDGRPSLGGVWVAHFQVRDPERVIIRNTSNGKSVVGALFRREREAPGPAIQVSSDAAEELGMQAGTPVELSIVALRRQEIVVAPPAAAEPEQTVAAADTSAGKDAKGGKAAAKDDSAKGDTAKGDTGGAAGAAAGTAAVAAADAAGDAAGDGAAAPKKQGFFARLFGKKTKPGPAETAPVAGAAPPGAIEAKPLDPVVATAAAGIAAAETKSAGPAPAPAPAPASDLAKPYLQVAIFSSEANAEKAVKQLMAEGLAATVVKGSGGSKTYWRVLIGPVASTAQRDAYLTRVRKAGYPDAYPVAK